MEMKRHSQNGHFVVLSAATIFSAILAISACRIASGEQPANVQSDSSLRLPAIFSDHMVLQADKPIAVWGFAPAGETVSVEFRGATQQAKAGPDGRWRITLPAGGKGGPFEMVVKGSKEIRIQDVLVGEVWLGSGQSNMELMLQEAVPAEIPRANFPQIRLFHVPIKVADTPQNDVEHKGTQLPYSAPRDADPFTIEARWEICTPQTTPAFSALLYFFGREIHQTQNAPVGLIEDSFGGTSIEAWMRREVLETTPEGRASLARWDDAMTNYPKYMAQYEEQIRTDWAKRAAAAKAAGKPEPKKPVAPLKKGDRKTPQGLFNGMLRPVIPYTVRGVIWYQGEKNARFYAFDYRKLLPGLIQDWRQLWGDENLPFLIAQLPNFDMAHPEQHDWPTMRESQALALQLPNTALSVNIDIGDPKSVHPTNKADAGHRLALLARSRIYGESIPAISPMLRSYRVDGNAIVAEFDYAYDGLQPIQANAAMLEGFEIAAADGKYVPAQAKIVGKTSVRIWADGIPQPHDARYAWLNQPKISVCNSAGLPMAPFRTTIPEAAPTTGPVSANANADAPAPTTIMAPLQASSPAAASKPARTPAFLSSVNSKIQPVRQIVYKEIDGRELKLDLFLPANWKASDCRPCFVAIHGGGWTSGSPVSMYAFADHCASRGMVAVCVQYRLYKPKTDNTVFNCVKDVRSAMRYLRSHATELGIDPQKIVTCGASAGGHLAAATAMFDVNEAGEDTSVSAAPSAMILFSAVIDTSTAGYGNAKIGTQWRDLSPAHQVRPGLPPAIVFHGTGDTTTPFPGAQAFYDAMLRAGNRCELVKVEGAQHTYMFKDPALYEDTIKKMDAFLASLGYVSSPIANANPSK